MNLFVHTHTRIHTHVSMYIYKCTYLHSNHSRIESWFTTQPSGRVSKVGSLYYVTPPYSFPKLYTGNGD